MSDQDLIIAIFSVSLVIVILALFATLFFLIHKRKIKQNKKEKNELQTQFQQTLLQTQLEIQEQTLKNISQEIHDNVGQVLSLAKLNLNTMDVTKTEQLQGKINNTLTQVSKAINDLRDLSKSFNTDNITAIGLIKAIATELDVISKTDSHKTTFRITGNSRQLEPQKELILFRIVQEALHNIIKHADAQTVKVSANYSDEQLELEITDNGKGFDLTALNNEMKNDFGLGIRNMNNRAKLIGAEFNMSSSTGQGTIVKITLPFVNDQQATK